MLSWTGMDGYPDDVVDSLRDRVRRTIAAAQVTVAQAEVLTRASQLANDETGIIRRCAWCGRLALVHWTPSEEVPKFLAVHVENRATHGICPDCLRRLEREGESRSLQSGV